MLFVSNKGLNSIETGYTNRSRIGYGEEILSVSDGTDEYGRADKVVIDPLDCGN